MKKLESAGWIAKAITGIQDFLGNHQNRIKNSLISTADQLYYWTGSPKRKNGKIYASSYIKKKISHYRRQWFANRQKLR